MMILPFMAQIGHNPGLCTQTQAGFPWDRGFQFVALGRICLCRSDLATAIACWLETDYSGRLVRCMAAPTTFP